MYRVRRMIRLWVEDKIVRFYHYVNKVELAYDQWRCIHKWRPIKIVQKGEYIGKVPLHPGRICRFCDLHQRLTEEQYYAEFGELGFGAWIDDTNTTKT